MFDMSQPVGMTVIVGSIVFIMAVVGIGLLNRSVGGGVL